MAASRPPHEGIELGVTGDVPAAVQQRDCLATPSMVDQRATACSDGSVLRQWS